MNPLDLAALRAAPVTREPFEYLVVPGFVPPAACAAANADYPDIDRTGSFPACELAYGAGFGRLLAALEGPAFRAVIEDKFDVDLAGRPTMTTVRGQSGPRDGNIHTDAESKLITVLIYMNPKWESPGGRLRLLRGPDDIHDVILEVPPIEGTLLAFKRSDNSWHGHLPHYGPRRVIQFNWVAGPWTKVRDLARHRVSAWAKNLTHLIGSPRVRTA